jgi:WD40 repeat protein
MAELPHAQRVTAIQFNPVECVLATACKDRMIRLWDLDRLDSFDACGPEATSAHAIAFNPDGQSLFAAYNDSLRQYGFEPTETLDHREMAWSQVIDMMVVKDNVVSCSVSGSTVSVWAVQSPASAAQRQKRSAQRPSAPGQASSHPGAQSQPGHLAREARNCGVQASNGDDRQQNDGVISYPQF